MNGSGMALAGQSNRSQDWHGAAPLMLGANRDDEWVLTLNLVGATRLLAVLSDGRWYGEVAEGPWPPTTSLALPEAMAAALGRLEGARLRLQLPTALDAWPWEIGRAHV